jgi:hypothetical protein
LIADPRTDKNSNGRFDYSVFLSWTGARLSNVPKTARFSYPDGRVVEVPAPIICEEHPARTINGTIASSPSLEGGHASTDKLADTHRKGGFYASIDGSVHWFQEPWEATTFNWRARAPSGAWVHIGADCSWGTWNGE